MTTALIVVDVQNDFIDGSLAVGGGEEVAQAIARHVRWSLRYDAIVITQDWHIEPGPHFSDEPDYAESWPRHCVAHSRGAMIHDSLARVGYFPTFRKGHFSAAYSGFEGLHVGGESEPLRSFLYDVTDVDVVGIATDYCVKATALDAVKYGYNTRVLLDLTAAVSDAGRAEATLEMANAGIELVVNA